MTSASTSSPSRLGAAQVTCRRRRRSPRSRATARSARWMRTRTAPSRPAEDAGDLGRRHLVDEAQDERAAAVGRQPADGAPRRGGLVAAAPRLDVERVGDERRRGSSGASGRRRRAGARSATTLRAIWNSQTRNVEAPSPSAGRARSSNRCEVREGREERRVRWRPRRRDGRRARSRRSCTPGPGTSDTGRRTGPGPPGPPRPGAGPGRDGRVGAPCRRPRHIVFRATSVTFDAVYTLSVDLQITLAKQ